MKTVAQGRPGVLGCTCGTCRLHFFRRRAAGVSRRLAFPAPSSREGETIGKTRTHRRRETASSCARHSDLIEAAIDDRTMHRRQSQGHGNHDSILGEAHDVAILFEPERKPGAWTSGRSRRVPAEVGLSAGITVTAIHRARNVFMVRRSEPAIAQNELNAS
ncbi:hypothetical protein S58_49700 [Bradyrhizobium oligotrophicum S58]|uniref:Uncharacterized protein n=1 Tax=Bradyrhizobium oligotrophicum S58 TaxID=1245469 RepID=M4ZB06_9BRAD|nr:hypothetical protein [Bradyrhizobium oligotrophicum]BAM90949.1 hypothetical protein S58_49700 [Bradyrhizobium oligotrophicum S58]